MTLKDIAREAGVSVQAVSAALNSRGSSRVSPGLRTRIREIAREGGYTPSFGYRLMHGKKTRTAAVLISSEAMSQQEHIRNLVLELMLRMDSRGYVIYPGIMSSDAEANLAKVRELLQRGAEHFIFVGYPRGGGTIEKEIEKAGRLWISTSLERERHVYIDSVGALTALWGFLRKKCGNGMRLLLSEEPAPRNSRIQALCRCFPLEENLRRFVRRFPGDFGGDDFAEREFRYGYAAAARLLDGEPRITGIACANDQMALGVARRVLEQGLIPGRDILLTGFNNDAALRNALVSISTADHNWRKHCEILIEGALTPGEFRKVLEPEVMIHEFGSRNRG